MNYNPNKAISANRYGINVFYTDTFKSSSVNYEESSFKDIQLSNRSDNSKKYYQVVSESDKSNLKKQINEALYGIKTYSQTQLDQMGMAEKVRIQRLYDKAQYKLNIWKQELLTNKLSTVFGKLFFKSTLAKELAIYPVSKVTWEQTSLTFRDLGITKEILVKKLVEFKLLPEDTLSIILD